MVGAARPMPGRWAAAGYTSLMVALFVAEPAVVSLTVHDHVQLDRLTGTSAERHGDLLPPGTTRSASPREPTPSAPPPTPRSR
jgi:hypothetical protein